MKKFGIWILLMLIRLNIRIFHLMKRKYGIDPLGCLNRPNGIALLIGCNIKSNRIYNHNCRELIVTQAFFYLTFYCGWVILLWNFFSLAGSWKLTISGYRAVIRRSMGTGFETRSRYRCSWWFGIRVKH